MTTAHHPRFIELSADDSLRLLGRNHIGRLAFSLHDRMDIEPLHYVYHNGWIYGRTGIGSKLVKLAHHPWCAFEVDEVRGIFDWDSVVVKGSFSILDPELGSRDHYERALAGLRALIPATFDPADPVPERSILFGINTSEITGRSART